MHSILTAVAPSRLSTFWLKRIGEGIGERDRGEGKGERLDVSSPSNITFNLIMVIFSRIGGI